MSLAALAGGIVDTAASLYNTASTNRQQQHLANQAFRQSRDLANTAHQREVEDLRKAGLNPLLSGTGGSGSGTVSMSTPTLSKAELPSFAGIGNQLETNARMGADSKQQRKASENAIQVQNSQLGMAREEQDNRNKSTAATVAKTNADTVSAKNLAIKTAAETEALKANYPALAKKAELSVANDQNSLDYLTYDRAAGRVKQASSIAGDLTDILTGGIGRKIKALSSAIPKRSRPSGTNARQQPQINHEYGSSKSEDTGSMSNEDISAALKRIRENDFK